MADLPPPYSEFDPAPEAAPSRGDGTRTAAATSGASSSLSQDSTFAVLKDAGRAAESLERAQVAEAERARRWGGRAGGYTDSAGNLRHLSPPTQAAVNPNQFFGSVEASAPVDEQHNSDSWGAPTMAGSAAGSAGRLSTTVSASTRLGIIEEASPSAEVAPSAELLEGGHVTPSAPPPPYSAQTSSLLDDGRQTTMTSEMGSASDSISLPATTPPQSRENEELFSTAVDEETLAAAKRRQKKPKSLFQTEDWEKVKPVQLTMTQVIDTRSNDHFQLGMQHMSGMFYERAINCFNKALNLRPQEVDYYVHRGECYLQLCDFQSAILNYKRTCVLQPENFTFYSRLAFIYYFQGQCLFDQRLFPEALESFSRAAEMRPEVIGYHTRSIACLAALQRHGECLALVNKRLEAEEHNADLYVMRARLHELFRNTTLCYYDIKDALTLSPVHKEATALMSKLEQRANDLKQQAMHLNLLHRHRDALQKITLAIETNPAVPEYHVLRGALNRRLGDFNAAIDDYLLALDKTDHNEESPVYLEGQRQLLLTYNDFAVECFTKGFYEEAIILLNKAIKGEKREKGLYINRGDCFFRQDHLQFALADYHQALEMDPDDDNVRSRIAIVHNEHGITEYTEKNYQEAESRFTLAIQHCPRVGQYYISRARVRQAMENLSGARQDVLMALHLDPSTEDIIAILSRLFPGKSVKDVLHSRAAAAARSALQNLVVTASPVKLKPLAESSSVDHSDAFSSSGGADGVVQDVTDGYPGGAQAAQHCAVFPDLKTCMQERDFHIRIATEKKRVTSLVQDTLHNRKPLKYTGGRVNALPDPASFSMQSKHPLRKEELAVKKPQGWRKFSLGIGIGAIPDEVK